LYRDTESDTETQRQRIYTVNISVKFVKFFKEYKSNNDVNAGREWCMPIM